MNPDAIKDHGGPAFPVQDAATWQGHGMTLRDYFAAKAMQGQLTAQDGNGPFGMWAEFSQLAKEAYQIADAMLAERSKA